MKTRLFTLPLNPALGYFDEASRVVGGACQQKPGEGSLVGGDSTVEQMWIKKSDIINQLSFILVWVHPLTEGRIEQCDSRLFLLCI